MHHRRQNPDCSAAADPSRRQMLALAAGLGGLMLPGTTLATRAPVVTTGASALIATEFAALKGKRIGLVTNQTGRVAGRHLADVMAASPHLKLATIFAPEHGFRGKVEAGAAVRDGRDAATGVPIVSLYGATKAPTPAMLRDVDMLVFDIQDIGARFYTYISTMGLALQAAARAHIPFVVLDRPNPLGGVEVAGFTLEPAFRSFVGQYPMPIVHGLTVGELAAMIKGERWLDGAERADLQVMKCEGLTRAMRWPATGLDWVATSPNIPTFEAALVYPGIGMVGETLVNEGRGTPMPFSQFGAPWLDGRRLAGGLARARLPGVRFRAVRYTPQAIPDVAANPRFEGREIGAVRIAVTDVDAYRPLEVGMHALALLEREARRAGAPLRGARAMFETIAGTRRLTALLDRGATGAEIVADWQADVARFTAARRPYLLY